MSPEVLARKLEKLRIYLVDLHAFRGVPFEEVEEDHYALERIFQLLVEVSTDILAHELARSGTVPKSYRDTVRLAAEAGLLPPELGTRLERAAGLRNLLVHLYEEVDLEILAESVEPALEDFGEFLTIFQARLAALGE